MHIEIERKFLVDDVDFTHPVLVDAKRIEIEQAYLSDKSRSETRVRKKKTPQKTTYTWTRKRSIDSTLVRGEDERGINFFQYWFSRIFKKRPYSQVIKKTRYEFSWGGHVFELDIFKAPKGLVLLEVELDSTKEEVELPPFVSVRKEVSRDPQYTNSWIATHL